MSRKYKIRDQSALYFVTFTVVNWLDVFIRRAYKDIFLDSIRYCQKHKGLEVCAYCIMSSHIHIHNNPVEAGIVLSPEHYLYSSAVNYASLPEKLIEVVLI